MRTIANRSPTKKLWYLKKIHVFSELSWRELKELKRMTHLASYRKNELISLPGNPGDVVFLLKQGRVKISRVNADGREATLAILEPGEIFGEVEATETVPHESLVQALEPVLVCEIQGEDFIHYIHAYPDVGGKILKFMGGRLRQLETRVGDLVFKSAPARLATILLQLSETVGIRDSGCIQLQIRLTHQNLANLIGTSRETVSMLMSQFAQSGLLAQGHRYIRILDAARLAKVK